ncbi:proteinase inhibitor I36 SMPI [Streptomyces laurentii]|uniref:Proteinase inhibitor I36 SMPI n=1 Tax=Streptomyces laurentii TaxID=39478 RepID=A0A160NYD6_STRLU|nr:proteinase inhibitor I36 SMPI [Streptomyces laurentii]
MYAHKKKTIQAAAGALAACCLLTIPSTGASAAPSAAPSAAAPAASSASASGAASGPAAGVRAGGVLGACGPGQLCLWPKADFKGRAQTYELSAVDIDSCTALPGGTSAQSLANRTGRPVTFYQSAECAETGEFETYPGKGVWAPQTPYQVRAFKIWER